MSATNRGAVRNAYDFYSTPENVVHNFLDHYELPQGKILEPSVGNGSIVKAIRQRERESNRHIIGIEIRQEEEIGLKQICDEVYIDNFLTWKSNSTYDVIIGNPPYSLAKEFIEKCFEISNENTTIIMLLRTAFLESKKRYDFWQRNPVNGLYVLSQRPSFLGNGKSDATSYSWFIWNNSNNQEIKVI